MEQSDGDPLLDSNPIDPSNPTPTTPQCQSQPEQLPGFATPQAELESNPNEDEDLATDVVDAVVMPAAAAEAEEPAEPSPDAPKKRKRGRPPKSQAAKPPVKKKENDEEEVCFICFDGGNLVCCDRRGCSKVYHAACVNRDEAFFQTKGKWNCGWHICSICEKAAQYMCYTCTYSLCKGCIKETGFVCVRGKKGFCETCYGTVMLIESNGHANEGKVGINFDDKNSFECLFKDYWFDVKRRLSLAVDELENAKVPSKGSGAYVRNGDSSSDELYDGNEEQDASSDSSSGRREGKASSRKKVRRRSRTTIAEESSVVQSVDNVGTSFPEDAEWASKELLEFVSHMKGGDKSVLSQFDVQALLLEYIKQNNLRDPRRKSQIICDPRLESLFGKARVGHFEMLKLLESHFLIKEASQAVTDDNQGAGVDPDSSQMDAEVYADGAGKGFSDKKRKNRKKVEEREPQTNFDDYAAIDVHNIGLIYLRRNLMEDLPDDIDKFTDKVVGAFVRIRIPSTGQKQDMYRLVQVVGTSKAAERYKTGRKTTDFILEILNLNKREVITIDTVSNQDFTQDECKRLRQSIKCGLISRLTVGDIHEKARVLQAVKVNDWLESEKQRLGHLRDRASETGRRKELRECVEKLQLLNTPEERSRRLNEVPEIHSDPKMDPDNESPDEEESDDKNPDVFGRPRDSSLRKGKDLLSPGRGNLVTSNWAGGRKGPSSARDTSYISRNARIEGARDKLGALNIVTDRTKEPPWTQERDVLQPNNWESGMGPSDADGLEAARWNNNLPPKGHGQSHGVATGNMAAHLTSDDTIETEKIWNYKDPAGKIQGPFSMAQLRKWNTTGYFPVDMRIWRTAENDEDSVLLTDALVGRFERDLPQWEPPQSSYSHPTTYPIGSETQPNEQSSSWGQTNSQAPVGNTPDSSVWTGTGNIDRQNADRWAPSVGPAPRIEVVNQREVRNGMPSISWEPSRDANSWSGQPQIQSNQRPIAPFNGNPYGPPSSYQGGGFQGTGNAGSWNPAQDHRNNWGPQTAGQGYGQQPANWGPPGQHSSINQWGNGSYTPSVPRPMSANQAWGPAQGNGWASVNNVVSSVSHPVGPGWGPPSMPAPPAPFRPMGTGWGNVSTSAINGGSQSVAVSREQSRTGPVANSMGGTGVWGLPSTPMADQFTGANPAPVPRRQQTGAPNTVETHSTVFPRNEAISPSNPHVMGPSSQRMPTNAVTKNHFFESDCPSPTPSNERQELPAEQLNELDAGKRWPEGSDAPSTSCAPGTSDPACGLQAGALKLGSSSPAETDPQDNMSPIRGADVKPSSLIIKPPNNESGEVQSLSAQRAGGFTAAAGNKQDTGGQICSPTPSTMGEPGSQKVEHLGTSNLGAPQDVTSGNMWSLPSPTPSAEPSGWNVGSVSPSGDNQTNPCVPSDGSKMSASSLPQAGPSPEWSRASQWGWDTGDRDTSSTSWGQAPQDAKMVAGSAKGEINVGWGTTARGGENTAWGAPAVGNDNPSRGWGTWQEHMNMAAAEEDGKKRGWGSGQEDTNGLGGLQNQSVEQHRGGYGRDSRYESRHGGGYSRRGGDSSRYGGDSRHDSSYGGDSRYDSRYGGDSRHESRYGGDSRHGGGRSQRNERMSRDRGGRSSGTPPRGEGGRGGICKFHESGHCKKGAACNYVHS